MATHLAKLGWDSLGTSFDCPCGERHALPIDACYIGRDAAERLAAHAREARGKTCLVVSDENTREAAGETLYRALSAAGKSLTEWRFGREPIDATDTLGESVRQAAEGLDFIVAVGAGTLSDLAKYAGDKLGIPVLLYPTAASMNGYTSAIVALKVRGLKRTLPCRPAAGIFADPAVSATAPRRMVAAGVADYLSKCSSSTDWRAAHLLRGGYFCGRPREFFEGMQENLLCAVQRLGRGEDEAYQTVLEALMLSGFSMVIAGSSAPASGGEHLISHYLDMKSALYGTPHDLHGAQVGVATIYCLELWERILRGDVEVDVERLVEAQPPEDEITAMIHDDWGPEVSVEVLEQWHAKRLSPGELRDELRAFAGLLPRLREECAEDLLPAAVVAKAIRGAGGAVSPEELTVPLEEYRKGQTRARYIRNRFTVLDLAAELGLS